jgi:hypothetical protein
MTLTFALLLAFGLAGTGALRLYVLSGDKRRLPAAILPLGGAIAALYVLFRNLIRLRPFSAASFPTSSGAGSCSGSRSRPPCRSYAGESAKASRVAEFADRTPPGRSPG